MANDAPIGVFDSGLGGLTVLREIIALLPGENTVYLGDTARVPYGIRSPEVVTRYSLENMRFLLGRGIKLLVIACNTASAISLSTLKIEAPVPVIGVIEPGARAAIQASKTGRVGVIGTETTVRSGAYHQVLERLDPEIKVFSRACPLFVPLAEEGWVDNEVARLAADSYLADLKDKGIDTLLLGCTHYPLLKRTIARVMGEGVTLIDSARETAREIKKTLAEGGILKTSLPGAPPGGKREFFVTDAPERFRTLGGRFFLDGSKNQNPAPEGLCFSPIKEVKLTEVWNEAGWQKK